MSSPASSYAQEAPLLPTKLRNARALWLVLIIVALIAGCALLFARGSMRLSGDWQSQLTDTLTVQIILDNANDWSAQTSTANDVLSYTFPGVDIEVVTQEAAHDLLRPWLGNTVLPDNLPVPGLINLTGQNLSITEAETALYAAGITANIDDNSRYADEIKGTARRLVAVGMSVMILLLLAGLSVNIFATRASMTAQKEIIRVLVQVGASDKFIAKLFIGQALKRGAIGAAIGLSIASLLWTALSISGDWGGLGWSGISSSLTDIFWLICLGALFAFICAGAAGLTTTRQLLFERKRL